MIVLKILLFRVTRTIVFFLRVFNAFKLFNSVVILIYVPVLQIIANAGFVFVFYQPARSLQILAKVTLLCHLNYYDAGRFFYHFGYRGQHQ